MKLRRYIISFAHMEMLLRGEHHFEMRVGLPEDAKILTFKPYKEGLNCFDILVESQEFEEVDNMESCGQYGSLALEGLPCMPIQGEVIRKQ